MPIDNTIYKIRGTELGEIKAVLESLLEGDTPTTEDTDNVLSYIEQAFQQPVDQG